MQNFHYRKEYYCKPLLWKILCCVSETLFLWVKKQAMMLFLLREISPGLWWFLFIHISLWGLGRWTGWQSFYHSFLAALDCGLRKHTYTHSLTHVYTKPCPLHNLNHKALRFVSCGGGDSRLILLSWKLLAGKGCTFIPASSDATWVPASVFRTSPVVEMEESACNAKD